MASLVPEHVQGLLYHDHTYLSELFDLELNFTFLNWFPWAIIVPGIKMDTWGKEALGKLQLLCLAQMRKTFLCAPKGISCTCPQYTEF